MSTEQEIEQFVNELQQTGDSTLQSFSKEKFDNILDWAHLLEVLRKYEGKMLVEEAMEHDDLSNSWLISAAASIASKEAEPVSIRISDSSSLEVIAKELAAGFGISEDALIAQLPAMMTANGNNPIQIGLEQLKDDLIFAEDLVLYQEEVIDHLWESYTVLKSVVEQKDEVINQLYTELTDLKEKGRNNTSKHRVSLSDGAKTSFEEIMKDSSLVTITAEKNIDPIGSREEWRNWMDEKHKLIQSHNEVKSSLVNEIRTLRKSLNPNTEQTFLDLQKSENLRLKLEEELVKSQIQCDQLRSELSQMQIKCHESETEKSMMESDWQERYNALLERSKRSDGSKPASSSLMESKANDYSAMDSALDGDPSVGIISRLNLVESKVKLFDNKFNDPSSSSSFAAYQPHSNSRSKSVFVSSGNKGIGSSGEQGGLNSSSSSNINPTQSAAKSSNDYPIDLSLRTSFPPGNGSYNLNKAAAADAATGSKQLPPTSSMPPSNNGRNSFGGAPTLSDLASFRPSAPSQQDEKLAQFLPPSDGNKRFSNIPDGLGLGLGIGIGLEEKKNALSSAKSHVSSTTFAVSPYSQTAGSSHSVPLYEPAYSEFKPSSSSSPLRRPPAGPSSQSYGAPRPNQGRASSGGDNIHAVTATNGSMLMDPQQRQVAVRIPTSAALFANSSSEHPLRNALRADTFSKLNGKGITMMTTRPYFKFNPKAKTGINLNNNLSNSISSRVDDENVNNLQLGNPPAAPPRFMSDTSSSHKRTASWEANSAPATVSGRRVMINRNSGGWKWK